MSRVHPLSTGSASKFSKFFDGEFFLHLVFVSVSCGLMLVDAENVKVGVMFEGKGYNSYIVVSYKASHVIIDVVHEGLLSPQDVDNKSTSPSP